MNNMLKAFKGLKPQVFVRAAQIVLSRKSYKQGCCYGIKKALRFTHKSYDCIDALELWFKPRFGSTWWGMNATDNGLYGGLLTIKHGTERRVMMLLLCAELARDANRKTRRNRKCA